MSFTGVWENSYGSTMTLYQSANGTINGSYRSSTGSTGTYYVSGFANPIDPSPALGQAVALSIFWRPVDPEPEDPSWHWVSGLGGQLTGENGVPTIILLHALVASTAFPEQNIPAGTWLDKLIYTPRPGATPPSGNGSGGSGGAGGPAEGIWICDQDPGTRLQISVIDTVHGIIGGSILVNGTGRPINGFTDTYAPVDKLPLQSLSISAAYDPVAGISLSLAGSLEILADRLSVTAFSSRGTAVNSTYAQTAVSTLTFHRQQGAPF